MTMRWRTILPAQLARLHATLKTYFAESALKAFELFWKSGTRVISLKMPIKS